MTTKLTLGDKVKHLRRTKGLTQSDLAGEDMTKSMLSQIENGRALPSMRSLQILAARLGVDAGYFLEEEQSGDLPRLVRDIEAMHKQKNYQSIVLTVKPLMEGKLPMTVDAARLMEFYVDACYYTGEDGWEEVIQRAVEIYERFNLYVESVKVQYMAYALLFAQSRYKDSLELILRLREDYVSKKVGNDFLFEIELHYAHSVTLSALGDYDGSREAALEAIKLSREQGVYYLTDHLYRVLSNLAQLSGNLDEAKMYLVKAGLYVQLTEDDLSIQLVRLSEIRQANVEQRYEEALLLAQQVRPQIKGSRYESNWYLQTGIALYHLGRDEEALANLSKVTLPDDAYHPLDRAGFFTVYAYKAKIYAGHGKMEEARQQSQIAYERVREYPPSAYTQFIEATFLELHP
ncbi:helix-turn-helix domain-containing protein [Paenibacillus sp. HW567]|uniref:helix-turn-helix domain-containing protein n=1 Tax=Paenibacillus sp. HW567 TaxID=1034769 RepID=UPI00035E84CD|nr:helix-turn-helix transcriptional regulator [Paenibacillus sp. HW567]